MAANRLEVSANPPPWQGGARGGSGRRGTLRPSPDLSPKGRGVLRCSLAWAWLLPLVTFLAVLGASVHGSAGAVRADEALADRSARLAQMDDQEREQLSLNYDRFGHLAPAERDRLRKLYSDLQADADGAELRTVMQRYHDWLNELPATQRTMLTALPAEERLKRIEEIRANQDRAQRLSPPDLQAIEAWARKHELRKKFQEARLNKTPMELKAEDIAELRSSLSQEGAEGPRRRGRAHGKARFAEGLAGPGAASLHVRRPTFRLPPAQRRGNEELSEK